MILLYVYAYTLLKTELSMYYSHSKFELKPTYWLEPRGWTLSPFCFTETPDNRTSLQVAWTYKSLELDFQHLGQNSFLCQHTLPP